jgi:hypothetical protein
MAQGILLIQAHQAANGLQAAIRGPHRKEVAIRDRGRGLDALGSVHGPVGAAGALERQALFQGAYVRSQGKRMPSDAQEQLRGAGRRGLALRSGFP